MADQQGVPTGRTARTLRTLRQVDIGIDLFDPGEMSAVVMEFEAITKRSYGQFCGVARALEVIGERWALLVVRDLLVTAKTFDELRRGLPRIPADTLATRLRQFERAGITRRRTRAGQPEVEVHELTEYGRQLDEITLRLGRWGAQMLHDPRPEEIVTPDSLVMAMRATFRPEHAHDVRAVFEIHIEDIVINLVVMDGTLRATTGEHEAPDLVMYPGRAMQLLMSGEMTPHEALTDGHVTVSGDPVLLTRFSEIFRIG